MKHDTKQKISEIVTFYIVMPLPGDDILLNIMSQEILQ